MLTIQSPITSNLKWGELKKFLRDDVKVNENK